jgi:hypothetical protein
MSKAVLCDKCKGVCSEQSATHIESKWAFVKGLCGWQAILSKERPLDHP